MMKTEYKQTKLGLIPEDWELVKSGVVIEYVGGGAFKSKDSTNKGIRWLKIANVGIGEIRWADQSFLPDSFKEDYSSFLLEEGDIVMALTRPIINGRLKIAKLSLDDTPALLNQRLAKICVKGTTSEIFIYQVMQMPYFVHLMNVNMAGTDPPNIGTGELKSFQIPLPPLPEQVRIADCLSQWDRGIALLERLIAQKEEQKKGLMQQLLTGRQRLPGFAGEWESVKYGKAFDFLSTASFSRAKLFEGNDIQCLHYGDIHTKFHNYIDFEEFSIHGCTAEEGAKYSLLKNGDLIMADASEDLAGVGKSIEVKGLEGKAISGLHTILMRSKSNLFADGFKAYIHEIPTVRKSLQRIATGAKVYGIAKKNLKNISIPIPPLPEQKAIAAVLNTADRELSLLGAKLGQYRLQKRGLMQQLLMGRKRLV